MYILECADKSYYTGSTKNLELRLEQHQQGFGANYTRKHRPVKLVYFEEYERIDEAFYREKQIQRWSHKKKEALIKGDKNKLIEYAASRQARCQESRQARCQQKQEDNKDNISTGSMTGNSTGSMTGNSTGSMTGNSTGSMTGNSTGSYPNRKSVITSNTSEKTSNDENKLRGNSNNINSTTNKSNQTHKFAKSNKSLYKKVRKSYCNNMQTAIIQQSNTASIENNKAKLANNIAKCVQKGAELIVLQELHNSLYFCQVEDVSNFDLAEPIPGPSTDFYGPLAKKHQVVLVISLFEKRAAGLYHNTAVVFEKDGSIAGTYRKMHIPDDPGFYEKFYFTPGDMGFNPIQTSIGKLGVLVCWDQWYPEAARMMALAGAEVLIYPTAIGWDMRDDEPERERQRDAWITVQRGHAVANGLPVIAVNRVGTENDPSGQSDGVNFWGNSFIAGPQGELLYEASCDKEENKIVDIDLKRSEDVRRIWPFLRDRRIDEYKEITKRFRD